MVSSKQKSRKMKMGKRTRSKKTNRSRKQRGGQTSTMSESTSSMPALSSSTSTMSASSTSTMPALTSTMPTSRMPASSTSTATSRVSKMPMSSSTSTSTKPAPTTTAPLKKVDIYFKLEGGIPKFVSSSDPGITVGATSTAIATININPSLGKLHDYSGSGWSQANRWVSIPLSKLNKGTNALRLSVGDNLVRKIGAPSASILPKEIQLPSLLPGVIARGLDKATFGIGTKPGDPKNENAVILITFMFA